MLSRKRPPERHDLFAYDYVLAPYVDAGHYSLFIMCHMGAKDGKQPAILHLDSFPGCHDSDSIARGLARHCSVLWPFLKAEQPHSVPALYARQHPEIEPNFEGTPCFQPKVPLQADGSQNCGPCMLLFAKMFLAVGSAHVDRYLSQAESCSGGASFL